MPAHHLASQPSNYLSKIDVEVFYGVIKEFLGQGLAYSEWPAEVKKRGYEWHPELENVIIKQEWEFFKPEIQRLRLEPNIARSPRARSNSLASILKRLKGEPWVEGRLDEREERLRTRRLLGKDAKPRCLQVYARRWDQEMTSKTSKLSSQGAIVKPTSEDLASQSIFADNSTPRLGSPCDISGLSYSIDAPEVGASLAPRTTDVDTDSVHSYLSQVSSPIAPHLAQLNSFSIATGDLDLLPTHVAAQAPNVETSGRFSEPELSKIMLNSHLADSQPAAMNLFDQSLIGEDDVPISADYTQASDLLGLDLDIMDWLDTNQVSENIESVEIKMPQPGSTFDGTFLNLNSPDKNNILRLEDTYFPESGSITERICANLPRQGSLDRGSLKNISQSMSPPLSGCASGRKRRRQERSRSSSDSLSYENDITASRNKISNDNDITMIGYKNNSQPPNEVISQLSWAQKAPPSGPLPMSPSIEMTSKSEFKDIRMRIDLERELQQTRKELNSVLKQRQRDLESFARKQQAAEMEILELREQLQEIQLLTEYYEGQVRDFNSKNIVLEEAISRNRSVANLSTGIKEREHSTKPTHTFPQSKNARPLSLTLRPATANKASSPPRKASTSTLPDKSIRDVLVSMGFTNGSSSPDNGQISSGQSLPASSSSKTNNRCNTSRSADNITASNLGSSVKKDTNPLQQLMHKFSSPFLRRQSREYYHSRTTSAVLVLPPLEASVPLNRQMASILIDGDKRLTNDSGYDSLQFETGSRASVADIE